MSWVMVGVGVFSAYNSIMGAKEEEAVANYNSDILRQRAKLTEQAMQSETERMHKDARSLKATQGVGMAKSGAVVSSGTPLMVLAEQAGEMEKDVLQMRRNKMIEAQGLRSEAAMVKYGGAQGVRAAQIGAVTTVLGSAAKGSSLRNGGGTQPLGSSSPQPMAGMPINRSYGAA